MLHKALKVAGKELTGFFASPAAFLFLAAFFQSPGIQRALALFLLTYCALASITETAFTDASTYLLDLTVAASLLAATSWSSRAA